MHNDSEPGETRLVRGSEAAGTGTEAPRSMDSSSRTMESHVVAFLHERSVPCPRCAYDLCNIEKAACPECGEPLVLKLDSAQVRFGWLVLAMAPGCFSGVAAMFLGLPISMTILEGGGIGSHLPWPIVAVELFGILSAASVVLLYRRRHRIMGWRTPRQAMFAALVWGVHVVALALFIVAMAMAV